MNSTLFDLEQFVSKKRISNDRDVLFAKYANCLEINEDLNRSLVSFQDNKNKPFYRWLKFKEGFSSNLVKYFINHFLQTNSLNNGFLNILDPFAGSGTTVITAVEEGHSATGIDLLPVGIAAMKARRCADSVEIGDFEKRLKAYQKFAAGAKIPGNFKFPHLRITERAFSPETEQSISQYLSFLNTINDEDLRYLFWFACFSILEEISYTSKDGQYLRWDYRSGRSLKSKYRKNVIHSFKQAILKKLELMLYDLKLRNGGKYQKKATIVEGSVLEELPQMKEDTFDLIITSPPYCNRYDYTRTYALELAFLGYDELRVKKLRQNLLSSTVENRPKKEYLSSFYESTGRTDFFNNAVSAFKNQSALQEVLQLLDEARRNRSLNNNNIPEMVDNYFFEMNLVIHELARVLRPGGRIYMVNDNVQYIGEEVPIDLILSDFAVHADLTVNKIWVLSRGKGNSSQQMGAFGRNEIRKCVYSWDKN